MVLNWGTNLSKKPSPTVDLNFILQRETIKFDIGSDGLPWAILSDNCWSFEYHELVNGHGIGNWNNYENAVCLQPMIGM